MEFGGNNWISKIRTIRILNASHLTRKLKEDKVKKGRHVFKNFRDSTLTSSQAMLDLIDIIQPGSIGYDMVAAGISHEVNCLIAVLPVTVDHSF